MNNDYEVSLKLSGKLLNKLYLISNKEGCSVSDLIEDAILDAYNISLVDLNNDDFKNNVDNQHNNIDIINSFYVYAYLNPNVEGIFKYLDYTFTHQPIYIGTSVENISNQYLLKSDNSDVHSFVNYLADNGQSPITVIIEKGISSLNAHSIEGLLIKEIGRQDIKTGSLLNKINGIQTIKTDSDLDLMDIGRISQIISALNTNKTIAQASKQLGISERSVYRIKNQYHIKKNKGVWSF